MTTLLPILARDIITVTGADAARFLHNYCTAEVNKMIDGSIIEAFFPNEKGRVLAHAWIERLGEKYVLSGYRGTAAVLLAHLGKFAIFDDVTLDDQTSSVATFLVVGDDAERRCHEVLAGSADGRFHRTSEAPATCYRVFADVARADEIHAGFASLGLETGSDERAEFDRISAGVPIVGVDISDANLVQEAARTDLAVSFTKGCYLGQEPIARLDAMGHTNKELRTLTFDRSAEPSTRDEVIYEGKPVGHISSVATADDTTVGLAILRKSACNVGTEVVVGSSTARVAPGATA